MVNLKVAPATHTNSVAVLMVLPSPQVPTFKVVSANSPSTDVVETKSQPLEVPTWMAATVLIASMAVVPME